ncbi:MAG: M15 family metallopeptidase [Actinobacteria bacterium]|nr:MAG: M15 family metallopeptidase [Actinomycetota bacterium]
MSVLALPLVLLAFHGSIQPLRAPLRGEVAAHRWHRGCPVPLSRLRVASVSYWGFDGRVHTGRLVVNQAVAAPLLGVFRRLYRLHFPIRRMQPVDNSGGDTSGFDCRQAVPSPCSSGSGTGHWSMHAYGEAVDVNPIENPYTGCGRTRERRSIPYLDRSRLRKGMVTPAVVAAFRAIGWSWGGDWTGTKDYMHFSANGH